MDIGRTEGVGGPGRIEGSQRISKADSTAPASSSPADKVEISEQARLVSEALSLPPVRAERVEEIRKLIQSGLYETDARLEGALQKFLEENRDVLG
jgi:flagellar biosynthesis anti-sigma factor FlgM